MRSGRLGGLVVLVVAIAALVYWFWPGSSAKHPVEESAQLAKFALVEANDRSYDGGPALSLTFTQPLDASTRYDAFVQVFEMPARAGERSAPQSSEGEETGYEEAPPAEPSSVSTKPEDTETNGGKVVTGAWVVGENPRLLYFPHIKPQTRYVVQVSPKLKAAGGSLLGAEARYSIRTGAVSPAYYFASRGMVLPAKQNGGLPVVTVNVPEVDVQFLRIKNERLPDFLEQVIAGPAKPKKKSSEEGEEEEGEDWQYDSAHQSLNGAVPHYELDKLHKMAESVYTGRFLTEQKQNRRSVTYIPVEDVKELQEPGIYVAVMTQPGRFRYEHQTTYFYVSDLGLHLRLFENSADTFVSSLTDGKAVKGVEVSWLDQQGKVLARGETDSDGRAAFAERVKDARVVLAKKGKQLAMIALKEPALDLSEFDITGAPYKPVRLFAYSGRNLYRPGETFDLSILARDADGRPVKTQPIQAILKRPDGRSQFTAAWQGDKRFPGYFLKRLVLPADAPTGFWTLELRFDPASKTPSTVYRFGVEEFLPERMKLDLSSKSPALEQGATFDIDVKGTYLYGAPAAGNQLLGVVQFERNRNPLAEKYPGFEFGDFAEDDAKSREELPETKLDEEGLSQVSVDVSKANGRHSPFSVRATMSLLETGGRPVIRTIERVLWPAKTLIGVRPLFTGEYARENSQVEFDVVRVNQQGKMIAAKGLPVRLFREDRDYYWRFEDQRGWHSGFTETDELVETRTISIAASGRAKLTLPVRYGRYRVEILDPETNQTLRYRFYAGWSAKTDEAQGTRPDRVAMKLDKPAYTEGDTAKLTITPPHDGEALVTVEGDRTLWVKRISVSAKGTDLKIPVAKEWLRHDLYVTVTSLRPGSQGDLVTPARAIGIVHLPLERSSRHLNVTLEAPQKMRPETVMKVKVRVPEAKGKQAVVTLYAVDVGILNITRFATPDPFEFFFGKLRYGADQHDLYGRLIEKMQGQKGRLKFGGDDAPKPTRSMPKKVKLIDLFSGPVLLNAQGEAEISLPVPDFNGTLRLMVAVASDDKFGAKEAEVIVAAPVVAELATPRFLAFGDKATIALDVHNMSGIDQQFKVAVSSGGGLVIQEGQRTVALKNQQKTTLRFSVESGQAFGLANINVKVEGKDIQLDRHFPLMVQATTPNTELRRYITVEAGKSVEVRDAELSGLHPGSVEGHLVLSDKPPIDIRSAIQGLLTYPYGCAEQTTSTAYPHVFVDEAAARRFGLKPYTREQRGQMLEGAIGRIAAMQAPNGGFSLWGNVSDYEYWLSSYVTGFLQDAREQGFAVPEAMHRKAIDFLLRGLQDGAPRLPAKRIELPGTSGTNSQPFWEDYRYRDAGRFAVLAHGAYILSRESKAPVSTLRQLYEVRAQAHTGLALVHLGLALHLMGDEKRAQTAIADGLRKGRDDGYWWGDYGTPLRDAALSYALLERHKIKIEGLGNLLPQIAAELQKQRYFSTQEKMALFLAGQSFMVETGEPWAASVVSGSETEQLSAKSTHFRELGVKEIKSGITVSNTGKSPLYLEFALSGHAIKAPESKSDPIALARTLHSPDGSLIGDRPLKVGESVMVHLVAKSSTQISTGLIVDRIPAGLEIENLNIVQGEQMGTVQIARMSPAAAMADSRIRHMEFRDDRFVAAVQLGFREVHLFYRARVVTPGTFQVPPVYAEDMYRPNIFGLSSGGGTLKVIDARSESGAKKAVVPDAAAKP